MCLLKRPFIIEEFLGTRTEEETNRETSTDGCNINQIMEIKIHTVVTTLIGEHFDRKDEDTSTILSNRILLLVTDKVSFSYAFHRNKHANNMDNLFMHLTNYAINKKSSAYQ